MRHVFYGLSKSWELHYWAKKILLSVDVCEIWKIVLQRYNEERTML